MNLQYNGFIGTKEYSFEDACWCGTVAGVNALIMYEGDTQEQLEEMFQQAVDAYICNQQKPE